METSNDKLEDVVNAIKASNSPIKDSASIEFIEDNKDRDYDDLSPKQKKWVDDLWEKI